MGSHILDCLRARGISTALLLRSTSHKRFLESHLPAVEVRTGTITDLPSLRRALVGITHVIHCAGCTRARRTSDYYDINHLGTQNVVEAINPQSEQIRRLLHISTLAVAGPATAARPAREDNPPRPVSEYGKSKLAGEMAVRDNCRVPFTVLRPPAVYGPRDEGFFSMFKAIQSHVLPRPAKRQELSLVFVRDLAQAVVDCLEHPAAAGHIYYVASKEVVTARTIADEIAAQVKHWTLPCPLPSALLWPICLFEQLRAQLTGKPTLLNLQKFAELQAPGWVCDPSRLQRDLGFYCNTTLKAGIAETLGWYRKERWL